MNYSYLLVIVGFALAFYFIIAANRKIVKYAETSRVEYIGFGLFQLLIGSSFLTMALHGLINEQLMFLLETITK